MRPFRIAALLAKPALMALLCLGLARGQSYAPANDAGTTTPDSAPMALDKVALGKRLFFDTRLSEDGWISCASCHDPNHGFSDPRRLSVGMLGQRSKRHSPTLLGR